MFFFQAEDGIRGFCRSRGLGDVYKRQALGSTTRPSSWPDPGHDEPRSGKWAKRRDAVTSAEVRSLHADSGTDQSRLAQALTSEVCVASSRDPTGKMVLS